MVSVVRIETVEQVFHLVGVVVSIGVLQQNQERFL